MTIQITNTLSAGEHLRAQPLSEFIEGGPIQPSQFEGDEAQRFERAIVEAGTSRNGGMGQTVALPRGELRIDGTFNCADRVSIVGVNKRGTVIAPATGFVGDYMATAVRGDQSMFDNALERLTLDCNHLPGLGGLRSDAMQEGGGLNKVLIWRFTTEGVRFRSGHGGAALTLVNDAEIMGSNAIKAETGIYLEQISLIGKFVLNVTNSTIAGSPPPSEHAGDIDDFWLHHGIHVENDSLVCTAVHFEQCTTGIYLDGDGDHVLIGVTGLDTVTNLVEIAETFTGTLSMIGCQRAGAANLLKDNRVGPGTLGTISYDTSVTIGQNPPMEIGSIIAGGNFNGSLTDPNSSSSFGVSDIVKTAPGTYTIALTRPGADANSFSAYGSSNTPGGVINVDLMGNSSLVVTHRVLSAATTWTAADADEIKFTVVRCA